MRNNIGTKLLANTVNVRDWFRPMRNNIGTKQRNI